MTEKIVTVLQKLNTLRRITLYCENAHALKDKT